MKRIAFMMLMMVTTVFAGEYVVIQQAHSKALVEQCSRSTVPIEGSWNLTEAYVKALEANIHKLKELESHKCCGSGRLESKPEDYYRQYVGVIINGNKVIYINAISGGWRGSKYDPQIVCDGGKWYWGAIFDPATKKFSDLAFNGES
jgi:hypothetical protein